MARKKKHPEHVNHERWLISYADFITLLFAFFVVMFAVSRVDSNKVGRFTEQFSKAVGIDMFQQPGRGLLAGIPEASLIEGDAPQGKGNGSALPEELAALKLALTTPSEKDPELAKVQVITRRNEIVLRLSDNLFFESGNDAIAKSADAVVTTLAKELKDRPLDIRIEGHTDNRPIKTARFRSNWDLSTGRATTIVARFIAEGIAPERLSAAGYGEHHPIAPNTTDEGRKQNRRVDIVVTPRSAAPPEPVHEPEPAKHEPEPVKREPAKHEPEPAKHEPAKHEEHHP